MKREDGPQFPTTEDTWAEFDGLDDYVGIPQPTITKREWFAGMAMQGILASTDAHKGKKQVIEAAYAYADLMLREKQS